MLGCYGAPFYRSNSGVATLAIGFDRASSVTRQLGLQRRSKT
jgi:hypothetical protein